MTVKRTANETRSFKTFCLLHLQNKKVMEKKYFFTAGLLSTIFYSTVAQTVKAPLTQEAWDTLGVVPIVETFKGKECFLLKSGAIILKNAQSVSYTHLRAHETPEHL